MADSLLENYNPLYDVHLRQYFALPHMQKHLRRMGLLDSNGVPVAQNGNVESELYARHHAMMDMMLRNRERVLMQLAELQKKYDAAEKVEIYRRVRSGVTDPDEFRRNHLSRSLSRPRRSATQPVKHSGRRRHSSNSFEDTEVIKRIETTYEQPQTAPINTIKNTYDRLSANAFKYQFLHKLDDTTLINYKDSLQKQLQKLKRFRDVSFGPHNVARHQTSQPTSWFFRRRSLPSLSNSAPQNSLHSPIRSLKAQKEGQQPNGDEHRKRQGKSQSPRRHMADRPRPPRKASPAKRAATTHAGTRLPPINREMPPLKPPRMQQRTAPTPVMKKAPEEDSSSIAGKIAAAAGIVAGAAATAVTAVIGSKDEEPMDTSSDAEDANVQRSLSPANVNDEEDRVSPPASPMEANKTPSVGTPEPESHEAQREGAPSPESRHENEEVNFEVNDENEHSIAEARTPSPKESHYGNEEPQAQSPLESHRETPEHSVEESHRENAQSPQESQHEDRIISTPSPVHSPKESHDEVSYHENASESHQEESHHEEKSPSRVSHHESVHHDEDESHHEQKSPSPVSHHESPHHEEHESHDEGKAEGPSEGDYPQSPTDKEDSPPVENQHSPTETSDHESHPESNIIEENTTKNVDEIQSKKAHSFHEDDLTVHQKAEFESHDIEVEDTRAARTRRGASFEDGDIQAAAEAREQKNEFNGVQDQSNGIGAELTNNEEEVEKLTERSQHGADHAREEHDDRETPESHHENEEPHSPRSHQEPTAEDVAHLDEDVTHQAAEEAMATEVEKDDALGHEVGYDNFGHEEPSDVASAAEPDVAHENNNEPSYDHGSPRSHNEDFESHHESHQEEQSQNEFEEPLHEVENFSHHDEIESHHSPRSHHEDAFDSHHESEAAHHDDVESHHESHHEAISPRSHHEEDHESHDENRDPMQESIYRAQHDDTMEHIQPHDSDEIEAPLSPPASPTGARTADAMEEGADIMTQSVYQASESPIQTQEQAFEPGFVAVGGGDTVEPQHNGDLDLPVSGRSLESFQRHEEEVAHDIEALEHGEPPVSPPVASQPMLLSQPSIEITAPSDMGDSQVDDISAPPTPATPGNHSHPSYEHEIIEHPLREPEGESDEDVNEGSTLLNGHEGDREDDQDDDDEDSGSVIMHKTPDSAVYQQRQYQRSDDEQSETGQGHL